MSYLSFIILFPFIGFLLNGLGGKFFNKSISVFLAVLFPLLSFFTTIFLSHQVFTDSPLVEHLFTWISANSIQLNFELKMDALSAIMCLVISGIGSLIHFYSIGYMSKDAGQKRYFAYLNLFLFFMLLLVLGNNLLTMFIGWEGVGLASYLLIGFWFEDLNKAKAGQKAFITNRIGDIGFLLGIFLVYFLVGSLNFTDINQYFNQSSGQLNFWVLNFIGFAFFIGATGKSAQIPLYVWLPDAMAGPTPVSALIHAATMVTAGVYMIARLAPLYLHAELMLSVISIIGVLTAFFAATMALVENDIKKILAYSTVSQLGFMFLSLGLGAFQTAIFHLFTHAFFKACLFLSAGAVIHALHEEQNIFKMGKLFKHLPLTGFCFLMATLAITGFPPFAGFFSKDEILWASYASSYGHILLTTTGLITALLTSFYMFRLFFVVFMGKSHYPYPEKIHEAPFTMSSVMIILALGSIFVGFLGFPTLWGQSLGIPHLFSKWLETSLPSTQLNELSHSKEYALMGLSTLSAFLGCFFAYFLYIRKESFTKKLATHFSFINKLLTHKYYVDEFYSLIVIRPIKILADQVIYLFIDRFLIDGFIDSLAKMAHASSKALSRLQTGQIQYYLLFVFVGLFIALSWGLYYV